ncbi:MAG TPA: hypothetical protein VMM81_02100 [Acidimicrobiia bacterium]|nr:hypothetical protein [Acidimicrobiia bacterium]
MRARIISVVVGLIVGGSLAAVGLALAPAGQISGVTATTTPASAAAVWWHDPYETLIGTGALIIDDLRIDSGQVIVDYRVESLSTARMGRYFEEHDHPNIAPEVWVLETTAGPIEASSNRHYAEQVRFEVPDTLGLRDILGLWVEQYRVKLPYAFEVELLTVVGARVELDDDIAVGVVALLEQRSSTGIGIGIEFPGVLDAFGHHEFSAQPIGGRWLHPTSRTPSPPYSQAYQLTWPEPEAPGTMRLRVVGYRWDVRETMIRVNLGGIE